MLKRLHLGLVIAIGVAAAASILHAGPRKSQTLKRFPAAQAHQAVAVDADHFYAISNREIGKYDKKTGKRVAHWKSDKEHPLTHLNSGVLIDDRLYCAHSNAPHLPRVSSIEIWDAKTLTHVRSHSLGELDGGSLNWIDRRDGHWWVVIAYYDAEGPNHAARTTLVQMDDRWQKLQAWVFPPAVLQRFAPGSNSGGAWGADGLLYCTGHDHGELYALRLPKSGSVLQLVETLKVEITGQGIAWDPTAPGVLYGINRAKKQVIVSRLAP